MIDPNLALQEAVRARLVGYPGLIQLLPSANILDATTSLRRFPAIVIGDGQTVGEFATLQRDTTRVYLDLHCWTTGDDLASAKAITGAVRDAMRDFAPCSIEDHRVVDSFIQNVRFLRDHEGETPLAHAVVTINAFLQEAVAA